MAGRAVFRGSEEPLLDRQVHPTFQAVAKTKGQEWRGDGGEKPPCEAAEAATRGSYGPPSSGSRTKGLSRVHTGQGAMFRALGWCIGQAPQVGTGSSAPRGQPLNLQKQECRHPSRGDGPWGRRWVGKVNARQGSRWTGL